MKKSISTDPTAANIARVLELLAEIPGRLEQLSAGLSEERLRQPLGPGERSFVEDLAHLLNTEARFPEVFFLALFEDEPLFVNIHAERQLGKLLRYEQFTCSELLAYFRLRRAFLMPVLESLTEEQWLRTIHEEGKKRRESIYWRARGQALHEDEHLSDLEKKLKHSLDRDDSA